MVTTLDHLVLSHLVYFDMRLFNKEENLGSDKNNAILIKVLERLRKSDGHSVISFQDLKNVLSRWQIVDSVKSAIKIEDDPQPQEDGFYSALFKNITSQDSGKLVYAIRGSDPGLMDLPEDPVGWAQDWVKTNVGELPLPAEMQSSYSRKIMAMNRLNDFLRTNVTSIGTVSEGKLSITGHSMAGALAQRLAVDLYGITNKSFMTETFNAPGQLHGLTAVQKILNEQGVYNIINYVVQNDPTGTLDLAKDYIPFLFGIPGVNTILTTAILNYLTTPEGANLKSSIDGLLSDPEYRKDLMKHVGKTQYMPGVPQNDTHALFNFFQYIQNGKLVSNKGATISLNNGTDMVVGTIAADIIDLSGGDDWIRAREGKDVITGGFGDDTYVYGVGDGHDTIRDYFESNLGLIGDAGTQDTLILENINCSQVRVNKNYMALVLNFDYGYGVSQSDSITIANYFTMTNGRKPIEKIKFKDTAILDFNKWLIEGTQGDDSGERDLNGNELNNLINGYDGNDSLYGHDGNDVLVGGIGNDYLSGGKDNNILEGGKGNDILTAGIGNDVYIFNAGDGWDEIKDYGGNDTLIIKGLDPNDISIELNDGILRLYSGANNQILIKRYDGMHGSPSEYLAGMECFIENIMVVYNGEATQLRFDVKTGTVNTTKIKTPTSALKRILKTQNNDYKQIQTIAAPVYDPLILDLDGDGIEVGSLNDGVYFDMNVDGFKEKVAWTKGDDGFLVRDINDDGEINDATELFGDRTKLANGEYATDGFSALAQLDSNGDGKIDVLDTAFSELKIWKDVNQDGISQSDELLELNDAGVKSISLANIRVNTTDINGNVMLRSGKYTKNDDVIGSLAEYKFNQDVFDSVDGAVVTLSEDIEALPQLLGTGTVHTLRNAMALDSTGNLKTMVKGFAEAPQLNQCMAMMDTLLFQWTNGNAIAANSRGATIDARILNVLEKFNGRGYIGTGGVNPIALAAERLKLSYDQLKATLYVELMVQTHLKTCWDALDLQMIEGVPTGSLEAVSLILDEEILSNPERGGLMLFEFSKALIAREIDKFTDYEGFKLHFNPDGRYNWIFDNVLSYTIYGTELCETLIGTSSNDIIFGDNGNDIINGESGNDTLYGGLLEDKLYGGAGSDYLDGGAGNDQLHGGVGSDTYVFSKNGGVDRVVIDLSDSAADIIWFNEMGINDIHLEADQENIDNLRIISSDGTQMIIEKYYTYYQDRVVFKFGSEAKMSLEETKALTMNLKLEGTISDDQLKGALIAKNLLVGFSGDDTLFGGSMSDTLDGGTGNDILIGGDGNDTYVISRGDGQDIIKEGNGSVGNEILWFKDINPEELIFTAKDGSQDLIISTIDGANQLTLQGYFGAFEGRLCFKFGDNAPWTLEQTQAFSLKPIITGTLEDDIFKGLAYSNAIVYGGKGNDTLTANGSGELYGGSGNDRLIGSGENSILDGGVGSDTLISRGNDTLIFQSGGARDLVHLDLTGGDNSNTIWFKGYTASEIEFTVDKFVSNSLLIRALDGSCEMVIANYFTAQNPKILLKYENTPILSKEESAQLLKNITFTGTSGDDWLEGSSSFAAPLIGGSGNDMLVGRELSENLYGGVGSDRIDGGAGNDTLIGGLGDDTIIGGLGSDIYEFEMLSDHDVISFESQRNEGDIETIWIKNMIASDIVFSFDSENPSHLILMNRDGTSRLLIENYYGGLNNHIQFQFGSTPALTVDASKEMALITTKMGGVGTDRLNGNSYSAAALFGGAGDDWLTGGQFNDELDGGSGDDQLSGGQGSDVYIFQRNGGRDRIVPEATRNSNDVETVWFKGLTLTEMTFAKETGATNNLVISTSDGITRMIIENYFSEASEYFQFKFSDAPSLTVAQTKALAPVTLTVGFIGDDVKNAPASTATTLSGGMGDDTLTGGTKNDVLDGGLGNDILKGGLGSDTYLFSKNGGRDRILFESSSYTTDIETIKFTDVSLAQLSFKTEQNTEGLPHLLIEANDGTQLIVENYFNSGIRERYRFQFGNEPTMTVAQTQLLTMKPINTGSDGDDHLQITYYTGGILNGGNGNDKLLGGNSADQLNGDSGDDEIIGYDGNDIINGGVGNDSLMGAYGNDTYVFTRDGGMDTIVDDSPGQETSLETIWFQDLSNKEIIFKPDQYWIDTLHIETLDGSTRMTIKNYFNNNFNRYCFKFGNEPTLNLVDSQKIAKGAVVIGSEKDDHLQGVLSTGNTIYGNGGNDWIFGSATVDVLNGGKGNDTIRGFAGNDRLIGGEGDDVLEGGDGANIYVFNRGDGQDTIKLTSQEDILELGSAISLQDLFVTLEDGDLNLQILDSDDRITLKNWVNSHKLSSIRLFDGTVLTVAQIEAMQYQKTLGFDGDEVMNCAGEVNDFMVGFEGKDVLQGGHGNDRLVGGSGEDTYIFLSGDGNDTYVLSGIEDKLELGSGISLNSLRGSVNNSGDFILTVGGDSLTFKDWMNGNKLASIKLTDGDLILTTNQIEALAGIIKGTGGVDTLIGSDAAEHITGGAGNDIITGGAGIDTYKFNLGDGQDIYTLTGIEDQLELGTGIAQSGLNGMINADGDYVLTIGAGTDILTFKNWKNGNKLASVKLADSGISLTTAQLEELAGIVNGTADDDTITASQAIDYVISGGAGIDTITGNVGKDTITGGAGNDIITGGAGIDTYKFNLGDGQDTYNLAGIEDQLELGTGIAQSSLKGMINASGDYVLTIGAGTDTLTLKNWNGGNKLASVKLSDSGINLTTVQLEELAGIVNGTAGNDSIAATQAIDYVISGGAGNDIITGHVGNDTITGGTDNDIITGGAGTDTYKFNLGDGQDIYTLAGIQDKLELGSGIAQSSLKGLINAGGDYVLTIGAGTDTLTFENWNGGNKLASVKLADGGVSLTTVQLEELAGIINGTAGNDTITASQAIDYVISGGAGIDNITGNSGNDAIAGDIGNDIITGGAGIDTYKFNLGDGQDIYTLAGIEDKLELGTGIAQSSLKGMINASGDYVLTIGAGTDTLTFKNWNGGNKLASVKLADGGINLTTVQLEELAGIVNGTADNDTITASQAIDYVISGGAGIDTITGNVGKDTITGGAGNDIITGGAGIDTYKFNLGDGQDTYTLAGIEDKLELGSGIAQSSLKGMINAGGDYVLTIGAGIDTLTFKNWNGGNKLASMKLADGGINLTTVQLEELAGIINGTAGNDTITATKAIDYVISGGAGIDTITGNVGKDIITGGTGNDIITGGAGIDTYMFNLGDGLDTYKTVGIEDTVKLGAGITLADLNGSVNASGHYVLTVKDTTNTLTFNNWNAGNKLAKIELSDGIVLNTAKIEALKHSDVIGTSAINTLKGNSTTAVREHLQGLGGNDILYGYGGDDFLDGGIGNDTLYGGVGNDVYIFNGTFGLDTIDNSTSVVADYDTASFAFDYTKLVMTKSTNDLKIKIAGKTDTVTVKNWYLGGLNQIDEIGTADSRRLLGNQVDQLIQAMATFTIEKGLTWEQAAAQNNQQYIDLMGTFFNKR